MTDICESCENKIKCGLNLHNKTALCHAYFENEKRINSFMDDLVNIDGKRFYSTDAVMQMIQSMLGYMPECRSYVDELTQTQVIKMKFGEVRRKWEHKF